MNIEFKLLDDKACMPTRATDGSAGYDLYSLEDRMICPSKDRTVRTGVSIHIKDKNVVGLIVPRSGLAVNSGIILGNGTGVIDADYQGEIKVCLWNRSLPRFDKIYDDAEEENYLVWCGFMEYENMASIRKGDRIAQLLFIPVLLPNLIQVDEFSSATERGENGFGSTGC